MLTVKIFFKENCAEFHALSINGNLLKQNHSSQKYEGSSDTREKLKKV
jgi:hypothetical protein